MDEIYYPHELAAKLNVSEETLRRWEKIGKITAIRTEGGHRRYKIKEDILPPEDTRRNIVYARVSSKKQEGDLQNQIKYLQDKYKGYTVISDIGSGLNFKRKGLKTILELLINGNIKELVVTHKDRLVRFGFDLLHELFQLKRSILTVMHDDDNSDPANELTDDLMSIITVFSSRYYGKRKYGGKKNTVLS